MIYLVDPQDTKLGFCKPFCKIKPLYGVPW